jgi:hypothetical protein
MRSGGLKLQDKETHITEVMPFEGQRGHDQDPKAVQQETNELVKWSPNWEVSYRIAEVLHRNSYMV